jgi:arsenite methyltransferase
VFEEIFRVLKQGGHFSISDVVIVGQLPDSIKNDMEMYAGCVSGAISKDEYLGLIQAAGFSKITLQKERSIHVPDDILSRYLSPEEIHTLRNSGVGIFSISVYAEKAKDCGCGPSCC